MKKTMLFLMVISIFSSCMEGEYNKLTWISKGKDVEIEILKKQIIIDSLKRHDIFKKDTFILKTDTSLIHFKDEELEVKP